MASVLTVPIIMFVTDRSVLEPAAHDTDESCKRLLELVDAWVHAGVNIVHIREATLPDRQLVDLVRQARSLASGTNARIVVNDRPDIALAAGADGVHLKDDEISVSRVRALGPPTWFVGRSVHDLDGAERAVGGGGVDYLLAGAIHETPAKRGHATLGFTGLQGIANAVTVPVVAIGGLRFGEARAVADAGAAGLAGIRMFCNGEKGSSKERSASISSTHRAFDRV